MPCSSEGYPPSEQEIWQQKAVPAACEMAKMLTAKQRKGLSAKTQHWIERHEHYDRELKKERAEEAKIRAAKSSGLKKLTAKEKKALLNI